jgi:hypothetical protein
VRDESARTCNVRKSLHSGFSRVAWFLLVSAGVHGQNTDNRFTLRRLVDGAGRDGHYV